MIPVAGTLELPCDRNVFFFYKESYVLGIASLVNFHLHSSQCVAAVATYCWKFSVDSCYFSFVAFVLVCVLFYTDYYYYSSYVNYGVQLHFCNIHGIKIRCTVV